MRLKGTECVGAVPASYVFKMQQKCNTTFKRLKSFRQLRRMNLSEKGSVTMCSSKPKTLMRKNFQGQTMLEYIILVALLAVASIPVAKMLGDVFRDRVVKSADEIAGGGTYSSDADSIVKDGKSKVRRSMKDFYK
jgi:type IV pilus assembly protein PilA